MVLVSVWCFFVFLMVLVCFWVVFVVLSHHACFGRFFWGGRRPRGQDTSESLTRSVNG